ncbi:unnamed protein product [Phaedon cochleariae]|uniref:THAP-type domain-containing protein n=1 Tax=Phaedon cochleariae TaxID=80249 RepID=A0A9N9SL30_PHACE|nr:unnamed protein product [Phaedon cochleariae]
MQQIHKTKNTKSRKSCSVPQCSSYCTDSVSLHKFSLWNPKLCKRWRNLLKIGKPITNNMYVCSEHFLPRDFTSFNKTLTEGSSTGKPRQRIKKIAIPSVNLPKSSHENTKCERRM